MRHSGQLRVITELLAIQNPLSFILRAALVYPNKVALVHPDVPSPAIYTFSVWYDTENPVHMLVLEHDPNRAQRIQNLAYALIKSGIKPGDRVAVIAPNW